MQCKSIQQAIATRSEFIPRHACCGMRILLIPGPMCEVCDRYAKAVIQQLQITDFPQLAERLSNKPKHR